MILTTMFVLGAMAATAIATFSVGYRLGQKPGVELADALAIEMAGGLGQSDVDCAIEPITAAPLSCSAVSPVSVSAAAERDTFDAKCAPPADHAHTDASEATVCTTADSSADWAGDSAATEDALPTEDVAMYSIPSAAGYDGNNTANGKVMVVDDEPINIKIVQKYLKLAGYRQIIGITDPRTVMNRLAEEQPDVVLLDIMMPEVSGLELLKQIRAERRWAYLPVIIVTAADNEETKIEALELGASDFLGKPVTGSELAPRVRNALLVKAHHDYLKHYAMELERQTRQLEAQIAQARTDSLTGLANRRALDEELLRQSSDCQRTATPLSVMILDVDHFKVFNDTHGHRAGDEALRVVAGILRGAMRQMDVVTRYGGEEFLVMLPGTSLEGAKLVAERTRQDIGKTTFRYDGKNLSLTVSVGVAQLGTNEHVTQMLQRSDHAMYAAKQAGRDRTYWHDGRASHQVFEDLTAMPIENVAVNVAVNAVPLETPIDDSDAGMANDPVTIENLAQATQDSFDSHGVHCDHKEFLGHIRQRIAEWKRGGSSFCLMVVRAGPGEGDASEPTQVDADEQMRLAGRVLSTVVRDMDIIGRYDTFGFCLMLPRTHLSQGTLAAERVRQCVESNYGRVATLSSSFKLNVGVVEVAEGDDPVRMFQRAEAILGDVVIESTGA